MDLSVYSFISKLKDGLSKPNRFRVSFLLPPGINLSSENPRYWNPDSTSEMIRQNDKKYNSDETINIFCHSCNLPQKSLNSYNHNHYGPPYRVPFAQNLYDPITFSFYTDEHYNSRSYFEIWQAAAVNLGTNTMNYYNEFVSTLSIAVLNSVGEETYGVDLFEAYPLNIGMVDLAYSNANAVQNITVTMSFRLWKAKNDKSKITRLPG